MESAVVEFLAAAGLNLDDEQLDDTPKRVADAWLNEFIDGYSKTPQSVLGKLYPAPKSSAGELVVVTHLRFHSMCPHHLLPYEGRAHLAYMPKKSVVGFGRLAALLNCLAHRLVLQEQLAREVARALAENLGSPATACIIEAKQSCFRLRGERQSEALTHAEAYEGRLRTDKALRRELWARLSGGKR
jgi:GTP cyclohydrolase I